MNNTTFDHMNVKFPQQFQGKYQKIFTKGTLILPHTNCAMPLSTKIQSHIDMCITLGLHDGGSR